MDVYFLAEEQDWECQEEEGCGDEKGGPKFHVSLDVHLHVSISLVLKLDDLQEHTMESWPIKAPMLTNI